MWPTFLIPFGGAAAAVEAQCFNDYTKLVDTTRVLADGFTIDPELQFTTVANRGYWLYGHLLVMQPDATGAPGFKGNFTHAGVTAAFQHMGCHGSGFDLSSDKSGDIYWQPIDTSRLSVDPQLSSSSVSNTAVYHIILDATLIVGASGGLFGLKWGLLNAVAGSTRLMAGSYFSVLELVP